jgi:3-methylcrotonyl-CoA carboxylase alpha subunit
VGFLLHLDGVSHEVEIVARRPHLRLRLNDREYEVTNPGEEADARQTLEIDGRPLHLLRAQVGDRQIVRLGGRTFEAELRDPRDAAGPSGGDLDRVRAPMPCSVIEINKQPGDSVARGETLATIESMKLQIALLAPRDGKLARAPQKLGQTFDKDEIVAELEPLGEG